MGYHDSKQIKMDELGEYWFVEMGPIPEEPQWHQDLYDFQSYPFPSVRAARLFAKCAKHRDAGRDIAIRHPDGTIEQVELEEL